MMSAFRELVKSYCNALKAKRLALGAGRGAGPGARGRPDLTHKESLFIYGGNRKNFGRAGTPKIFYPELRLKYQVSYPAVEVEGNELL